jgi:hypothetical protein
MGVILKQHATFISCKSQKKKKKRKEKKTNIASTNSFKNIFKIFPPFLFLSLPQHTPPPKLFN